MAEFRFYCLNDQDHIVLGETLDVLDLEAAIQAAYQACHDHPRFSSSRIEVWQGDQPALLKLRSAIVLTLACGVGIGAARFTVGP